MPNGQTNQQEIRKERENNRLPVQPVVLSTWHRSFQWIKFARWGRLSGGRPKPYCKLPANVFWHPPPTVIHNQSPITPYPSATCSHQFSCYGTLRFPISSRAPQLHALFMNLTNFTEGASKVESLYYPRNFRGKCWKRWRNWTFC